MNSRIFGTGTENDLTYKEVRDRGNINVPSTVTKCSIMNLSIFVIYSGVRPFRALYVRVALL